MRRILIIILLCSSVQAATVHGPLTTQIIDTNGLGHYNAVIYHFLHNNIVCFDSTNNLTYYNTMYKTNPSGHWENFVHKFDHATGIDTSVVVHSSDYSDGHFCAGIGIAGDGSVISACETGDEATLHPSPVEIKKSAVGAGSFALKKTTTGDYSYPHFVRFGDRCGFILRGTSNNRLSLFADGADSGETWIADPLLILQLNNETAYATVCGATDRIRFCVNVYDNDNYEKIFFLRSKLDFGLDDSFLFENISASHSQDIILEGNPTPILLGVLTYYYLLRTAPSGCNNAVSCIAVTPDTGRELFLIEQWGTVNKAFLGWYDGGWHEIEIPIAVDFPTSRLFWIYPYSESVIDVYGVFNGIGKRYRTINGGVSWYFVEDINEDYNISYIALAVGAGIEDELVLAAAYLNNGIVSADILLAKTSGTVEASEPKQSNSTFEWFNF